MQQNDEGLIGNEVYNINMKYNKNIGPLKQLMSSIHYLVHTSYTTLYFV